ncbi:ubiquitin-conjugating enzyme E2 B [Angomonas deanei]|nr:ubiquitin-conjugating enzyme E2 B [Angomonas deanei]EPY42649.1 ubiquitin-conjugating enzyme E2 B [Angomonas deanei]|eukprot:EPY42570.1 ubiquitin-conjugating enzyme E2 B [Angomonas deanei]
MQDLKSLRASTSGDAGDTLGIYAAPKDDDIFVWKAVVYGPENTVWEGGFFKLELHFSAEYPVVPPRVKFLTKVFHPNVYVDGNICLDTLKSNWSPTLNVEMLLLSIRSLLCDPNPLSAANGEAAQTLTTNPQAYEQKVKELVAASLEQSISDDDA